MTAQFIYRPAGGFTTGNGYVKEIESLGDELVIALESLDYKITMESFTDWGYALNVSLQKRTISLIIQIKDLDQGLFRMTLKPSRKWYQTLARFEVETQALYSHISCLNLGMTFR